MCPPRMKQHVVLKLHSPLSDDATVPNWLDFIKDKSMIRESVDPEVDGVMRDFDLPCG